MLRRLPLLAAVLLTQAAPLRAAETAALDGIVVSVADQRLAVFVAGKVVKKYAISTSRFGLGDRHGSYRTPLGNLEIAEKIGDSLPAGAVLKRRVPTGEILAPNARGRDPVTSRILRLRGLEPQNQNAYARCIYIHGSPEEKRLGRPVSYGCIRMRARDVIELYAVTPVGTKVSIVPGHLPGTFDLGTFLATALNFNGGKTADPPAF